MADNAYCPNDYGDKPQGQAVQVVQWRQTVSQIGLCNAVTGKRPAQAAIVMRDTISDQGLKPKNITFRLRLRLPLPVDNGFVSVFYGFNFYGFGYRLHVHKNRFISVFPIICLIEMLDSHFRKNCLK